MLLRIENAECGYGRAPVLSDLTLDVGAGEILAVFGPNGAGKSTLLKLIVGVLRTARGRIVLDGTDVTRLDVAGRVAAGIVLSPEGRHIFNSLSVEENLRIGASILRVSLGAGFEAAVREGIERAYELFPVLRDRRRNSGGALSGGQQQMLAIARALMARPKLLLLDEPSLGLAPLVADEVYATLSGLRGSGMTLIIAEEGAGRPLQIADRGILMRRGRIALQGAVADTALWKDLGARYLSEDA